MANRRRVFAPAEYIGSTSSFYRTDDGLVLKSLHTTTTKEGPDKLIIEKKILERLDDHPRIIPWGHLLQGRCEILIVCPFRYKEFYDFEGIRGLLFAEASHGDLQNYIDQNNHSINVPTRRKWCRQVTEAVQYLHRNDVIHSDLRPGNCLLHESNASLDLLLCDFGGSMCRSLDLDGGGLPDPPFWDLVWESTVSTDIFSLGSIFYTIMTGHWPYRPTLLDSEDGQEDKWGYEDRVIRLMKTGQYPELDGVIYGTVILGCWERSYADVEEILQAQDMEMRDLTS